MTLDDAQRLATPKIKEYLDQRPDVWGELRGREVFMFDRERKTWTVVVGIFPREATQALPH